MLYERLGVIPIITRSIPVLVFLCLF